LRVRRDLECEVLASIEERAVDLTSPAPSPPAIETL